jgi:hypothetical protein
LPIGFARGYDFPAAASAGQELRMILARWKSATRLLVAALANCILSVSAMSAPLILQNELGSDFFRFFHLEPTGTTAAAGGSLTWHSFRPSGPAFHSLVEVDVLAGGDGAISAASIGLERSFINDPRNAVFARDIAKSFLAWTIRSPSLPIGNLIANIADLSRAGGTVIMRGPHPRPPPPDTTGAYDVYRGRAQRASIADAGLTLTFTNFPGTLPSARIFAADAASRQAAGNAAGWLRIDVAYGHAR